MKSRVKVDVKVINLFINKLRMNQMKKTILMTLALLLGLSTFAQEAKVINDPYYEFKTSGIDHISRIELSTEDTRVYVQNTFLPNWWLDFNGKEVLVDADTQQEYEIIDIEGAKFGERTHTPTSGVLDVVMIFPPLATETKRINYDHKIFGVSLDENLAGLQANHSTPIEINEWMDAEIAKCVNKPLKDFKGEDFFTSQNGRLIGYIKGYSPKSKITTGIIYLNNYLTREDYPVAVSIEEDGRFDVEIPLISPIYSNMRLGNVSVDFYLEPGQTLGMIIDWEDFLLADQLRDRQYKFQKTAYKGNLAQTNFDLMRFQFEVNEYNSMSYRKQQAKMTFEEKVAALNQEKMIEMNKLDYYIYSWKWTDKASVILKNSIILKHARGMIDLENTRIREARKEPENKELQEPMPENFYDFFVDFPWDDQSMCITKEFSSFINRFEYSAFITKHRETPSTNFPAYFLDNEASLSKDDKALLKLAIKEDKTPEEIEILKERADSFKGFREKYSATFDKFLSAQKTELLNNQTFIWIKAENELSEKYNIAYNLPLDIAKLRSLKYRINNASKEDASAMWTKMSATLKDPYFIATGDSLLMKTFAPNADVAYTLPQGKATDIFNDIIAPYKGKVLFVDFWATFCGPCIGSITRMKETRQKYEGNEDFEFVFITDEKSSPQDRYDVFVKEQGLVNTHRISTSDYLQLRSLFKFNGIPRYVVISKDGKVINDNFSMHNFESSLKNILK